MTSEKIIKWHDGIFKVNEKNKIFKKVSTDKIPKEPVVREEKETTKIRAVFDASCLSDKPSLNECLCAGPNLLSKVFDILQRFRFNFIVILADIKQGYLDIEILKEHRDFLPTSCSLKMLIQKVMEIASL